MTMESFISCVQINLQHSKAASVELNKKEATVAFMTEPYAPSNRISSLLKKAHHMTFSALGPAKPRAALRVKSDLNPWLVTGFTDEDMCVVAIKISGQEVYLCSLYLDILQTIFKPAFLKLVEWCNRKRMPLVIGMDSNAHSPLWGSDDKNARGEDLENIFLTRNITVINAGSEPTFETSRAKSVIDVTALNNMALQKLHLLYWEVGAEASRSDHKYITFTLGKYIPVEESYRNLKRADWELFQTVDHNEDLVGQYQQDR